MSTRSLSKELLEQLARDQGTSRAPYTGEDAPRAEPANYALLVLGREWPHSIEVARLLVRAGLSVQAAHRAIGQLATTTALPEEARPSIPLRLPNVPEPSAFEREFQALGVRAERRRVPDAVDLAAVRARLGLSREAFAARFALEPRTIEGWEQGRFLPDSPARILLKLIERDPDAVEAVLEP
jgi:putative transcriptional regulator